MLGDQSLQLRHHPAVFAHPEIGLDPLLERQQPQRLQPRDLGLRPALILDVRERAAPPERQRTAQRQRRLPRLLAARVLQQPLEIGSVRLHRAEQIAGAARDDRLRRQRPPQFRYVSLEHLRRAPRRPFPPQPIDQAVLRDDLAGVQKKEHEQRPLPAGAERELAPVLPTLDRPENTDAHHSDASAAESPPQAGTSTRGLLRTDPIPTSVGDRNRIGRTERPKTRR